MKDDWDAVSSPVSPQGDGVTDWDSVSTPQAERPPIKRKAVSGSLPPSPPSQNASAFLSVVRGRVSMSFLIRLGLFIVVIVGLFAAGHFGLFRVGVNSVVITSATATAQIGTISPANATATAQTAAAAATLQQLYTRATSGTPAIDDPLSSENGDFGLLSTTWGGACAFTGGAYHLSLAYPVYWIWCVSKVAGNLNNFALQVQINITKGDDGGVVFGYTASGFYRVYIRSNGAYALLEYIQSSNQTETLRYGSSPAIKAGVNQTNAVTVVEYSGSFYLFVNGQFVTSGTLNDYNQGAIGLAAESLTQPTDIAFSSLKVWTL